MHAVRKRRPRYAGLCTDLVTGYEATLLAILVLVQATINLKLGQFVVIGIPKREARHLRDDVRKAPALLFPGLAVAALAGLWCIASETGCLPTSGESLFTPLILMPCLGMCIALTTLRQRLVRPDIASPELKRPNFFNRKGSSS